MTKPTENKPEAVPDRAIRDGEILLRWSWVEPTGLDRADVDGPRSGGQRR